MKYTRTLLWILAIILLGNGPTLAAITASDTIKASANIQEGSLGISGAVDLTFGTIVMSGGANSIVLDASSGATTTPTVTGTASVTGAQSGRLDVTTTVDADISITYAIVSKTAGTADKLDTSGGQSIDIANISTNSTASPLAVTTGGPNEIHVGGAITIPSGQTAGIYEGTLTVTVSY